MTIENNPLYRVREELSRIRASDFEAIRLDVSAATRTALGVVPNVAALRPAIVARFGEAAAAQVDALELHALAASDAHAAWLALGGDADVAPLFEKATAARDLLRTECDSLVARGLLDRKVLGGLRGGNAYADRAVDVQQLVAILVEVWPRISSATPITIADVEAAHDAGMALGNALGRREQSSHAEGSPEHVRAAAFTLFARTYSATRRIVTFLRWHEDDADRIAPSLYAGRAAPRRDRPEAPEAPAAPVSNDAAPGLPNSNPFPNG